MDLYKIQRSEVDKFNDQIIEILKKHFNTDIVKIAKDYTDKNFATDFVVYTDKEQYSIACRLRQFEMFLRYPDEFTIRKDTEIAKIRSGLVDYAIYGFVDPFNEKIIAYRILDLNVFRNAIDIIYDDRKPLPNNDGGHDFYTYRIDEFPAELVVEEFKISKMVATGYNTRYRKEKNKTINEIKKRFLEQLKKE